MGRGAGEKLSARRDKAHVLFGGTKILQHTPDKVICSCICFTHFLCVSSYFDLFGSLWADTSNEDT